MLVPVLISRLLTENDEAMGKLEEQIGGIDPITFTVGLNCLTNSVLVPPDDRSFYDICCENLACGNSHGVAIKKRLGQTEHVCISTPESKMFGNHPFIRNFLLQQLRPPRNGHSQLIRWSAGDSCWVNIG